LWLIRYTIRDVIFTCSQKLTGQLNLAHGTKKKRKRKKNKNGVGDKNGPDDSPRRQSEGEVKLRREGFVKQVGFKPGVHERVEGVWMSRVVNQKRK